jgi:hypothetical protein
MAPVSSQGYLRPSGAETQAALKAVIEALHMTGEEEKDVPQVRVGVAQRVEWMGVDQGMMS